MIRPTTPSDTPTLVELTAATGVFKPLEIDTLLEVLNDYHAEDEARGHRAFTWEEAGGILGYVYYAPAAMTDRTWFLYWIAVAKAAQGKGIGARLLKWAEEDIRSHGGRVLFIETSSTSPYQPTRDFYLRNGYETEAQLRDFYADGDDMVVFRKAFV